MCFGKKPQDPGHRRNEEIEKVLRNERKRQEKEVKLLLLGAGESGKSTVLKQMRVIHTGGFSRNERKQWRAVIFNNLINAFNTIFLVMEEHDEMFEDQANTEYMNKIKGDPEIGPEERMPAEYLVAFNTLWDDRGVQMAMLKGNEYALHDNLSYFFDDVDRLFAPNYLPSDQDILRTRLRTTANPISETIFQLGNLTYRMFDVGGQRSERKKWIHCFDNVQVVLFLVAISGYDLALIEDRSGNQMSEALMLWESIVNSKYFERSAMILFLNKIDLFREKIASGMSPIRKHFPDFNGKPDDIVAGHEFFSNKFKKLVRSQSKEIYVHLTNATDTDLLKKTMQSVQDMIVQRNLNQLIL
ncbi:guanine nucleotide binding protein, alpha subunit [Eremomyces bilateralis CBS 781.70]|uniref:Guanine nucleotide-binding protein alpha-2 subunit n=1 Tax=Eremomyces bilateralis CBS 781.70 TaxID=1392243 RepID=A0A6G1GC04_9PEZI|nr:guanine nucleotide binding protein, alpha subunit [Eremomyces bilateralis CBS 781.70]KAF1815628.1 guanine nucleotide binding protein, alpha subunit [Eremomyces bilateralis CBS 781.70]